MKIVLINGMCLAGKDTFVNLFKSLFPPSQVRLISTIDPIKKVYAERFGWNGEKSPIDRQNLFNLKQIWISTCNGPLTWVKEQVYIASKDGVKFLFIMVREYDEMKAIKDTFPRGSIVGLYIKRNMPNDWEIPEVELKIQNSFFGREIIYDYTVYNETVSSFPYIPKLYKDAYEFKQWCDHVLV